MAKLAESGWVLLPALARLCPVQHPFRLLFFFFFLLAISFIRRSNLISESAPTTPSFCNSFVASNKKTKTMGRKDQSESVNTKLTQLTGLAASTSRGNNNRHKFSEFSQLCCPNQQKQRHSCKQKKTRNDGNQRVCLRGRSKASISGLC